MLHLPEVGPLPSKTALKGLLRARAPKSSRGREFATEELGLNCVLAGSTAKRAPVVRRDDHRMILTGLWQAARLQAAQAG